MIAELAAGGYLTEGTLIWATGRANWLPAKDVPEIWTVAPPSSSAEVAREGEGRASAAEGATTSAPEQANLLPDRPSQRSTVVKAAKAVKAIVAPVDRELAAFQAEMSALGATDAPAPEDAALNEPSRAETPPPEDRRFEDDDGTWFVWDSTLRRFVEEVRLWHLMAVLVCTYFAACPMKLIDVVLSKTMSAWQTPNDICTCCQEGAGQGAGTAAQQLPDYQVEEMTFEMDDEKIPEYKPPKSDDEDEPPGTSQDDANDGAGEPLLQTIATTGT